MNRTKWVVLVVLGSLLAGGMCYGDDWPQFRGPNRDGKSAETGLLKKWPVGKELNTKDWVKTQDSGYLS
jgi:hypothetical protein